MEAGNVNLCRRSSGIANDPATGFACDRPEAF
jgi:hypothetical protein